MPFFSRNYFLNFFITDLEKSDVSAFVDLEKFQPW